LTLTDRLPGRASGGLLLAAVCFCCLPVSATTITECPSAGTGFIICATFDASVTGNANANTIENTIDAAITQIESHYYNPITVNISFDDPTVSGQITLGSNVGENVTSNYVISYQTFLQALDSDAQRPLDVAALLNLPSSLANGGTYNDPANDMMIHSADAAALGIAIPGVTSSAATPDGTVYLNLGAMNYSRSNPASAATGKYDLETVAMHEIDEVLGTSSTLGQGFPSPYSNYASPIDLFRYDASNNRTFSTSSQAWFEISPGTQIAQFNSSNGMDYGDWASGTGVVRVQDAAGTTGTAGQVNLSTAEIDALGVIGYDTVPVSVPEPSTWTLFGLGTVGCALWRKLRA
jgi:hypothetical protein